MLQDDNQQKRIRISHTENLFHFCIIVMQQLFKSMIVEEQLKQKQNEKREQQQQMSGVRRNTIGCDENEMIQKPQLIQSELHPVGVDDNEYNLHQQSQFSDSESLRMEDIKAIMNTVLKSKKTYSKQYIPLGSIVDNCILRANQIRNLHFEHILLNSVNQDSLHKVVFKHNQQRRQMRFYIPTFLRFSLIKLHSQDLKNITHIENKNNLIIYINVYTKGLPKMFIDKLTKRSKEKDGEEEPKLLFRANRHLLQAKYYTSYNDYLIFMFNPFSETTIEFEIMKNVMFAPFQQAELILHIRINKKVFKLQRTTTLKISKNTISIPSSPMKDRQSSRFSSQQNEKKFHNNINSQQHIDEEKQLQQQQEQQFDILHFNKIILQFKLQKPKNVVDSFRFHKSIEFGNYGIMTNQINIHIGTYQSPEKKKELEEEKAELNYDDDDLHQTQLEDISSLRLSIGLYKHPVTDLCTFFIPVTLAGGLTILLFHLCDHSLANELEVLSIILVAYGAFIPQFRDRISMSRTVIIVDFYILFNMIPAVLCALQSINEARSKKTYNSYQVISIIIYYISVLFLIEIYLFYLYVDEKYFRSHTKQMVHNFDTEVFQTQEFEDDHQKFLSFYVLKNQNERAYFCQRQDPSAVNKKPLRPRFTRKQTQFLPLSRNKIQEIETKRQNDKLLGQSLALEIRLSSANRNLHQIKQSQQEEQTQQHQQHQHLYKTKVIENQRHIHTFEKILNCKIVIMGILIIFGIVGLTVALSWGRIKAILSFEDLNRNCIHDDQQQKKLSRIQSIINRENTLSKLIYQNWDQTKIPQDEIDKLAHEIEKIRLKHLQEVVRRKQNQTSQINNYGKDKNNERENQVKTLQSRKHHNLRTNKQKA